VQAADLAAGHAEQVGQDLIGVCAQLRGGRRRAARLAGQCRGRAGHGIVEAAGLGGAAEHRIGGEEAVVLGRFGQRAVGRPADALGLERGGQIGFGALGERRLEQRIEPIAVQIAHRLVAGEGGAEFGLQSRDSGLQLQRLDHRAPLPGRDRHHHQPAPVLDGEIAPKRSVDVVADARSVSSLHHLRQHAPVGQGGGGDVGERDAHLAAAAPGAPRPLG
jgi:hypothetical protein